MSHQPIPPYFPLQLTKTIPQARGKEALRGPAYHQRLLPAYTTLKYRQPGQGGEADRSKRDLRAELEAAEAAHYAKLKGAPIPGVDNKNDDNNSGPSASNKRPLPLTSKGERGDGDGDDEVEDPEAKRRRILAETRDIDADSDSSSSDSDSDSDAGEGGSKDKKSGNDSDSSSSDSDDSDSDSDDEEDQLARELERIRRERAEQRAREERARQQAEQEAREREIARGNPLLNKPDFTIKRRWDDDVVFKNQARGTEDKGKKPEFVNVSPFLFVSLIPLVELLLTSWCTGFVAVRFPQEVHEQVRAVMGAIGDAGTIPRDRWVCWDRYDCEKVMVR